MTSDHCRQKKRSIYPYFSKNTEENITRPRLPICHIKAENMLYSMQKKLCHSGSAMDLHTTLNLHTCSKSGKKRSRHFWDNHGELPHIGENLLGLKRLIFFSD